MVITTHLAFAETVVSCSTEVAFRIVFQLVCSLLRVFALPVPRADRYQIRTIYRDLAQTVEREQSQLQLTLANQIQLLTEQLGHQRDHSEALTRQLNQQHEQYEIRMAELRADRADAIEKDKQNTLVLHSHLLHIPRLAIPVLRGKQYPRSVEAGTDICRFGNACRELARGQARKHVPATETPDRAC